MVWQTIRRALWVTFALTAGANADPVDGVYFEAGREWGIALQIAGDRVTYTQMPPTPDPFDSNERAVGSATIDADRLHLTHPKRGSMTTTWAIVDGELWTNVLRRTPAAPNVWRSHLAYQPARQPDRIGPKIVWDLDQATLSFAWETAQVRFDQVSAFNPPASDRAAFIPLHASEKSMQAIPYRHGGQCMGANFGGALCAYGLFASRPNLDPAVWSKPSAQYRLWRQTGDTIITPWSHRWGPVGLVPDRSHQPKPGRWVGPNTLRSPTRRVEAWRAPEANLLIKEPPPQPKKAPRSAPTVYSLLSDVPHLTHHTYQPNAEGMTISTFGQDCGQGHADWMGHFIWFPLADGRVVLRKEPASHDDFSPGTFILRRVDTP